MTTPCRFSKAWSKLREGAMAEESAGMLLSLQQANGALRVFAGVDRCSGMPSIVLETPAEVSAAKLMQQSCFGFQVVRLREAKAAAPSTLVALRLASNIAEDLFAFLGESIGESVRQATSTAAAFASVVAEIERWRRFFRKHSGGLGSAGQVGLIGELAVLELVASARGALAAVESWRGPLGAMRDFELADVCFEVKTYSPASGGKVRISDPLQLEVDSGRPLLLACQEVSVGGEDGCRLPDFVNNCKAILAEDSRALERCDSLLAAGGYLSAHDSLYDQRYKRGGLTAYFVDSAFPRLPARLIPAGVEDVSYSLSVASLAAFEVDFRAVLCGSQNCPSSGDARSEC